MQLLIGNSIELLEEDFHRPATKTRPKTPINDATGVWTLYQSDGSTQIATGSLTNIAGSNGDYAGTIDDSDTVGLTAGSTYILAWTLTKSGNVLKRRFSLQAHYRTQH